MTITKFMSCLAILLSLGLLASCNNTTANTIIEMEMAQNYDTTDPFINAKLIYVSDDIDKLELDATFQMKGESCTLDIADHESGQVVWTKTWNGDVEKTDFPIALDGLEKEKEYIVRLTGTKISHAKIGLTSDSKLVKERQMPLKPKQGKAAKPSV